MFHHHDYAIKSGYKPRQESPQQRRSDTFINNVADQPHVYELAIYLADRGNFKYIVDIGNVDGEKLKDIKNTKVIAIDNAHNIKALRNKLPQAEVIEFDLEEGLPPLSEDILQQAVIISSGVIDSLIEPHKYFQSLAHISKLAPYVLISTVDRTLARGPEDYGPPSNPLHIREWSIDELYSVLLSYGVECKIGHTVSNAASPLKETSLAISGLQSMPPEYYTLTHKTALAIMTAYNEEDIIEQSIFHLLRQGLDVHVINNWSTDKTLNIVQELAKKHYNVTYENFPLEKPKVHKYEWKKLLTRAEEIAETAKQDWIIHNDVDEFRLSPWKNISLLHAISYVSQLGYNAIDFTVAEFRPTKDGYTGSVPPDEFFSSFEFTKQEAYFHQIKGWENKGRVKLAESGGHDVEFSGRKVYPLKFVSKHYPLRSVAQAKRKVFSDRLSRFNEEERKLGWHIQYDHYKPDDRFIWEKSYLNNFTPDFFYTEYMVELLSGIGIRS